MIVDAVVLGAGISGLVASSLMLEGAAETVLVIDAYDSVGGNHIDVSVNGFTFDIGSLIFQDDSPLLDHFPELLDNYIEIFPTWAKLTPRGSIATYPFSFADDVLAVGPIEVLRIIASAISGRLGRRPMRTARDFAQHWVGDRFLRASGLENYMVRFCGCPIAEIDLAFATSRMMWIKNHAELRSLLRRAWRSIKKESTRTISNKQLARPRGGFGFLYNPVVDKLKGRGAQFMLGAAIESIARDGDTFVIRLKGNDTVKTKRVISTIPLDICARIAGVGTELLPTVTLRTLFYSFQGDRGFSESVLYNFSYEGTWKRLTVYSDFYGPHESRQYFAVEVILNGDLRTVSEDDLAFRNHVGGVGLLNGDLILESSHLLEHAYPIYLQDSESRAQRTVAALAAVGVESFGRQGAFKYQSTARVSTQDAEIAISGGTR